MTLSTIKGKLTLILAVLVLSFSLLGYEMIKTANDGKMAAVRLSLLGKIEASVASSMMELLGFQLLGNAQMLKSFEENYANSQKNIDELRPILLSSKNQTKLVQLKNDLQAWYQLNIPRIELLKKYGKVNTDSFMHEHKAEYEALSSLTKQSAQAFEKIDLEVNELAHS
nr:methyl-accepting chemotaxis protein [Sulfurospirillum sp.]